MLGLMKTNHLLSLGCGLATLLACSQGASAEPLTVHEWGTFTTVHEANGEPRGNLNVTSEKPLPDFVHIFQPPTPDQWPYRRRFLQKNPNPNFGNRDINMRLETPVIYFYSQKPEQERCHQKLSVSVAFKGGILNEFYPVASADVMINQPANTETSATGTPESETRQPASAWAGPRLNEWVQSRLEWPAIQLLPPNQQHLAPTTDASVWLAPRQIKHACTLSQSGPKTIPTSSAAWQHNQQEYERYLFYRGMAHKRALLATNHSNHGEIVLLAPENHAQQGNITLPQAWILTTKSNGDSYYQTTGPITLSALALQPKVFQQPTQPQYYANNTLTKLYDDMHQALVAEGLFADEASAMLNTWQHDYFKEPGTRILYLVPESWVNQQLPMQISHPHELTRVFVGRIDLFNFNRINNIQ